VPVLDLEPALARGLPSAQIAEARAACTVPTATLDPPGWRTELLPREHQDARQLLLVEGFILQRRTHYGQRAVEVLGPGDVVGLRSGEPGRRPSPVRALGASTFAILDERALRAAAPWPTIQQNLLTLALNRVTELADTIALMHLTRLAERLHRVLWRLAARWGEPDPEGRRLPFSLNQQDMADLVGARRPSVNAALGELRDARRLHLGPEGQIVVAEPFNEASAASSAGVNGVIPTNVRGSYRR
jgi:CRP-like cAMP-binding protein